YQKKEWNPKDETSFAPALCNRIDRNTGGIVIAAKNAEALRIMNDKIKDRELDKRYLAILIGKMNPAAGKLEGFLLKDEVKKQVTVYHKPVPGAKTAVTLYKTLKTKGDLSLVECQLLTGRTHQIRAQFADAGCPLLGDGKYGREKSNKAYGRSGQALYSYELTFTFPTDAGILNNLKGQTFRVDHVDFVTEYFGESKAHS
ncbi:MAG: RNA pseudouridine synthase, partial [Pseudoflavonifractor sp.]